MDLRKLQKHVNSLPEADWQNLVAGRKAFTSFGDSAPETSNTEEVLDALASVLAGLGVEHVTVPLLRRTQGYDQFKKRCEDIGRYLDGTGFSKTERQVLLRLGVRLLYDRMLTWNVPVSARTLMSQIDRLPSMINHSFPGYAAAGMLRMIVRRNGASTK